MMHRPPQDITNQENVAGGTWLVCAKRMEQVRLRRFVPGLKRTKPLSLKLEVWRRLFTAHGPGAVPACSGRIASGD